MHVSFILVKESVMSDLM